jgi:hypothetical protein
MSNGANPNTNFGRQDGVDLRTYFEAESRMLSDAMKQRIGDLEEKINLRFQSNQIALDKAEGAVNIRLESMNEFRNAMKDQSSHYLTKEEYEMRHQALIDKIAGIEKIVYMFSGAILLLEFLLKFFIK